MQTPTREDIAVDFDLWGQYVDPHATMTEEEFESMTMAEKVRIMIDIWGNDEPETDE